MGHRKPLGAVTGRATFEDVEQGRTANQRLLDALHVVVEWADRARVENQQAGPVLRYYLNQASEAAWDAITKARGEGSK